MRIWLLQISEPLPLSPTVKKMRTALLAEKLVGRGHQVTWWTGAFDHTSKKWLSVFSAGEQIKLQENYTLVGLKGTGYSRNISLRRYIDHRIVARQFRKKARMLDRPDMVITSMPTHDLAYEAVDFGRRNKVPVIVDIRDPWPDAFLFDLPAGLKLLARIVLLVDFRIIRKALEQATSIVAVTRALLTWSRQYTKTGDTTADRVFYLGYKRIVLENKNELDHRFASLQKTLREKYIVLYLGAINRNYHNPFIILEAAKALRDLGDIHFIIAGDGHDYNDLSVAADGLVNVTLTGWLNSEEIEYILCQSKIGLCPTVKTVNQTSNKIYMYLSAGLPLVSSFHGEAKEWVEKYRVGYYYPPNDVQGLVERIRRLYQDKEMYKQMSANAIKLYEDKFNADKIYTAYAEYIEEMAKK
ncbi:MAG: glycosyltransferase family 4 protein [bacterium]|nr:glycosyltransferase family 4 protein [bacterium]